MKFLWALTCAAFVTLPGPNVYASEIPLPQRKPSYQYVNADPETLSKAKSLLEQIHTELNKTHPQTQSATNPSPQTPAHTPTRTVQDLENLAISHENDLNMVCGDLSKEALYMRDIIYTTQDIKDRAKMQSHGVTAAGAIGSFLIGSVTGGVGLALGGFLLDQNIGQTEDDADSLQDTAAQRRTLMMGIYNAKGCEGPLEHAMQNPEIFNPLAKVASIETAAGDDDTDRYNN